MIDLEGKVAFVTAGATGIGFGCAQQIVAAGGSVMICARRKATLVEAAERLGERAAWVVCDVADDASVDAAVAATVERFGALGDVDPSHAVFLDDFHGNVDAARRLGMHGLLVEEDPAAALAELDRLLA